MKKVLLIVFVFSMCLSPFISSAQIDPQKVHFMVGVESGKFNDSFIKKIYPSFVTMKIGVGSVKEKAETWLFYEFGSVDGQAIKIGNMSVDTDTEMEVSTFGLGYNWKFAKPLFLSFDGTYTIFTENGPVGTVKEKVWGLGVGGGLQFNLGEFAEMSLHVRYGYAPMSSMSRESYEGDDKTDMGRFTIGGAIKF